mmetsp:Transcript_19023/g.41444  ORF Transcript_19023/g.41444 Transcript_19023/m.41444 type:complete len:539 (+) Transcript_19023:121-1737(+)
MSDYEYSDEESYEYCYTDDEDGTGMDEDDNPMDVSQTEREFSHGSHHHNLSDHNGDPKLFEKNDGPAIRMLPSEELKPIMHALVQDVADVCGCSESAAAILMREHKWDKERLLESYVDDPARVQKKCGVLARCQDSNICPPAAKKGPPQRNLRRHCEICMDEDGFDQDEMIGMPCAHEFCDCCWEGYFHNALSKGPLCIRETCPQAGCNELVTEEELTRAAPDLLPKFERYQLRSFVDTYSLARWCPGPGCEKVALARPGHDNHSGMYGGNNSNNAFTDVNIAHCDSCQTTFCFKCGEEPHAPVSCKLLSQWREKCRNESETANWILANTKPCPKCSSRIEKNQGCNHMTCSSCRYEFCWICMGNWADHGSNTGGYYKCNKFDAGTEDNGDQSDAAKAKRELNRYLHYYKRFHGHAQAQDFARKSVKDTEQRMVLLQEQNSTNTWADVEFLKTANELLVECRKVLKYTYVYAYYLTDKQKLSLFEYDQEMLERFTEKLSELSEKPLQEMNRIEVVNQTRAVDRFMKNVLKYVEEGMED